MAKRARQTGAVDRVAPQAKKRKLTQVIKGFMLQRMNGISKLELLYVNMACAKMSLNHLQDSS